MFTSDKRCGGRDAYVQSPCGDRDADIALSRDARCSAIAERQPAEGRSMQAKPMHGRNGDAYRLATQQGLLLMSSHSQRSEGAQRGWAASSVFRWAVTICVALSGSYKSACHRSVLEANFGHVHREAIDARSDFQKRCTNQNPKTNTLGLRAHNPKLPPQPISAARPNS
jgi:hypothetical protein